MAGKYKHLKSSKMDKSMGMKSVKSSSKKKSGHKTSTGMKKSKMSKGSWG